MERVVFKLENVEYAYPQGVDGIENATFQVRQSDTIAVLGSNGSGKSTLLKILDGLYEPCGGKFYAFGEKISAVKLKDKEFSRFFRSKIGMLFQDVEAQLFSPTVYDEIAFSPRQLELDEDEVKKRVLDITALLGIKNIINRYPHSLSTGEKRKVALASVFSFDPQVYLLDEPTANIDPKTEGIIIDLILDLKQKGRTVIVATQDLLLADHFAKSVILMSDAKQVVVVDDKEKVFSDTELLHKSGLLHSHKKIHKFFTSYVHSHIMLGQKDQASL